MGSLWKCCIATISTELKLSIISIERKRGIGIENGEGEGELKWSLLAPLHPIRLILKNRFDNFNFLTIELPVFLSVLFSLCEANDCLKSFTESNCLDVSPYTL